MIKFLLKVTLTVAALWLAFRNVEWQELEAAFQKQESYFLFIAFGAIIFQTICGGLRWHQIRSALNPDGTENATRTTMVYYISTFFNVCVPSTIGSDVARIWISRSIGDPVKEIVYGVIIDRIMSLVGLALLVATTLPYLFSYIGIHQSWGIALSMLCWVGAILSYVLLRWIVAKLRHYSRIGLINDVLDALQTISGKHARILSAIAWAASAHIAYATAAYAIALSLGVHISWLACIVLVPLVLFIATLPISLGGWGVREASMAGILALVSTPVAQALVISIQLGLITAIISLGGGLVYLILKKK